MEPLYIFPSDIWRYIYSFLSSRHLLSLWKCHPYFNRDLTETLRRDKRHTYGIDLVSSPSSSRLTTYFLIQEKNNVLQGATYHLTSDITCDTDGDLFIIRGTVTFQAHHHKITLVRGVFFRLDECTLRGGDTIAHMKDSRDYALINTCEKLPHVGTFITIVPGTTSCIGFSHLASAPISTE